MGIGVYTRDVIITASFLRYECGLGDKERTRGRASLRVVGWCLWAWDMICVCTYTGKWGEDDAVLQVDVAYADGGEECGGRGSHGTLIGVR
jgi:hypothetical protein